MADRAGFSSENADSTGRQAVAGAPGPRICALLPEVETALSCLQWALAAAKGFKSDIRAVHVGFDPRRARASAEELEIQQLRDLYEGAPHVRLARVKTAFDAFVAARPDAPPIAWKNDEGDIGAVVIDEARAADLIVIGRPVHLDGSDALHSALFDIRRLVLVVPPKARDDETVLGRHVVVGWKPGDPVRRAIVAAKPWLDRAEKVSVVWVAKHGAEPYDASARAFFREIGVAAEIVGLQRDHASVGHQLLGEAKRLGADCLVIGAFKHGALWDAMLGGVTRDVLSHAATPVFLMR